MPVELSAMHSLCRFFVCRRADELQVNETGAKGRCSLLKKAHRWFEMCMREHSPWFGSRESEQNEQPTYLESWLNWAWSRCQDYTFAGSGQAKKRSNCWRGRSSCARRRIQFPGVFLRPRTFEQNATRYRDYRHAAEFSLSFDIRMLKRRLSRILREAVRRDGRPSKNSDGSCAITR